MTDRELMQQALEAFENVAANYGDYWEDIIAALRERLAQPETRLATREEKIINPGVYKVTGPLHVVCQCDKCKAQKLMQPEQEPVAWMYQDKSTHEVSFQKHMKAFVDHGATYETPLYATPPRREWVGLTDEEYSQLHDGLYQQGKLLGWVVDQVEAKLKEKNA